MNNLLTCIRKEWLEMVRTQRLLIVVVVLTFFGLLSPLLARYMIELFEMIPGMDDLAMVIPAPVLLDAVIQYVKNIQQFGFLLAIFLTIGSVTQEKERGTAVMVLVKPVPRGVFLGAKLITYSLLFVLGLGIAGAAGYYYTLLLFEAPDFLMWLILNALLWLFIVVYISLTLLASTLVRQQAAAAGIAFGAMLVLSALGAVPVIGEYLPGQLVSWGIELFLDPTVRYWPALWTSLGLIAGSYLAAWLVFRRQEL